MAGRTSILLAPKCMAWLALFLILCSDEPGKEQDSRIVNVFIASALNIKHFPARNSCNSRKYVKQRRIASSAKYLTAINFGEIALLATYLVLLSVKVMTNPGPSHYRGDVPTFLQKPGPQNCTFKHREPPKTFRRTKDLTSGLSLPYYQPEWNMAQQLLDRQWTCHWQL